MVLFFTIVKHFSGEQSSLCFTDSYKLPFLLCEDEKTSLIAGLKNICIFNQVKEQMSVPVKYFLYVCKNILNCFIP